MFSLIYLQDSKLFSVCQVRYKDIDILYIELVKNNNLLIDS